MRANQNAGTIEQEQIDWSILLRVAAEFQAFCLEMHELVADELIKNTATQNGRLEIILRTALRPTHLNMGNPTSDKIKKDFARVGIPEIWNLAGSSGAMAKTKLPTLSTLLKVRNAIAHGQYGEIQGSLPRGLSVYDFVSTQCLPDLDHVVSELDFALSVFIDVLFGLGRPW